MTTKPPHGETPEGLRELARRTRIIGHSADDGERARLLAYAMDLESQAIELEQQRRPHSKRSPCKRRTSPNGG